MNKLKIEAAVITHIGSVKSSNEDNYYINGRYKSDSSINTDGIEDKKVRDEYTYAVFDGMGGEGFGELASLISAATLEKFKQTDIREGLNRYLSTANEFVCDLIMKENKYESGSTMALLSIQDISAIAYNVGDSRVYMCRAGNLYLLTQDHVDINTAGNLTLFIGIPPTTARIIPYTSKEVKLKNGDIFLVCTDGLTDVIKDEEIVEILAENKNSATAITKQLVAEVQNRNGKDDVTAIVVKVN